MIDLLRPRTLSDRHLRSKALALFTFCVDKVDIGSYFLEPHILKPTRITSHSSTLIDNIFFNSIEYQTVSGNLLLDLTDHLPHFLIIERFAFSIHKDKSKRRDYSNYNEEALLNEFSSIDWFNLFHGLSDTTEMFDKFYTKVNSIINSHLPLKPLTRKESKFQTKPWITLGLKASIINKNRLCRHYLKTRTCYSHTKFKCYRNKLNHLLKLSKTNYYKEYFMINKAKPKEIWKGRKQLICLKSKGSPLPSKLIINEPLTKTFLFYFYFKAILILSHLFLYYFILTEIYFIPILPDKKNRASILFEFYFYFKPILKQE